MDANQRSEVNNQTDNVANDKRLPGASGKTADGPLDHSQPRALGAERTNQGRDTMGAGPDVQRLDQEPAPRADAMLEETSGGSGTVQGITDSHQRQMAQKSGAYGVLEEPLGHRPRGTGVDVSPHHGSAAGPGYGAGSMQSSSMQSGSMQSGSQGGTGGGGMHGPQSAPAGLNAGAAGGNRRQQTSLYVSDNSNRGGGMLGRREGAPGNAQEARHGNTQLGVSGSQAMTNQNADVGGVHESNDAAGGLPRSPGDSGARHVPDSTNRAGSQTGAGGTDGGPPAHDSNDAAGGYPRSPGYANRLAGDQNMDDDTGFKRKP